MFSTDRVRVALSIENLIDSRIVLLPHYYVGN